MKKRKEPQESYRCDVGSGEAWAQEKNEGIKVLV